MDQRGSEEDRGVSFKITTVLHLQVDCQSLSLQVHVQDDSEEHIDKLLQVLFLKETKINGEIFEEIAEKGKGCGRK